MRLDKFSINGSVVDKEIVEHRPSVGIIAVQGDSIFLVRQYRRAADRTLLEIPAGKMEDGETPVQAARRELAEEAGFETPRLYNLSRVDLFYSHRLDYVALIPAFVAVVEPDAEFRLSEEHDEGEWLLLEQAKNRVSWPRLRRGLEDAEALLGSGGAGPLDDVLRV